MLITSVAQLTPNTLTAVLRHNGFLWERASVASVQVLRWGETAAARHYILDVRYRDPRSLKDAPPRIFLKLSRTDYPQPQVHEREVTFYERVAPAMRRRQKADALPMPVCYDAWYDDTIRQSHLILQDLSEKYQPAKDGQPPSRLHWQRMIEALAALHAFWWEHPALGDYAPLHTEASLQAAEALYARKYALLLHALPHRLNDGQRRMLAQIAAGFPPRRRQRMLAGTGMTLVHRDAHPGNFLYSYNSVRLIDWQSWRTDSGMDDVAYLLGSFMPEAQRQREASALLKAYYDALVRLGVRGYRWDDCLYDYRASLARCVAFLLVAWRPEEGASGWYRGERALRAFASADGMSIYAA